MGFYLLKELLTGNWGGTPFASQLNTVCIPFSIIIILIGLIYYLFMLVKPNNLINSKYLGYLKGTVALITFILALVLISIPIF